MQGNFEEGDLTILLNNWSDNIPHVAIDFGVSLIKLVYFSRHADHSNNVQGKRSIKEGLGISSGNRSYPILGGQLHFVKFKIKNLNECLDLVSSKQLHRRGIDLNNWHLSDGNTIIKAAGGGAYKYAELFKERLGVSLDKEDGMDRLVAGANFLLKAICDEAFTHMEGQKEFVQIDINDLFPYLLVNIDSGVSMIKVCPQYNFSLFTSCTRGAIYGSSQWEDNKCMVHSRVEPARWMVDGDGSFQRVSWTHIGGGTHCGLGGLLTTCKRDDNRAVDMLFGDIYGGLDYSKIGLPASTIASSFGKATYEDKELSDYRREDLALSLLQTVAYNIARVSFLELISNQCNILTTFLASKTNVKERKSPSS
ncbi:pantothenate kinase 2 [Cinnamomum micranthum f. kanehirae]|uniref:Pantothenate kinase 2 n=1 Tax=Cinnamomum micranthum f. kanehirae TaxID=337451 RepID=A0A443PRN8_9MAGN|nr:pantothenate kinase 2 [Cinnamomum micranthum f. kanehirae]